jgi:hypothetical protein
MRLFFFLLSFGVCFSVSAQQKAKFKTAKQAQKEDSVYQATRTDTLFIPPIRPSNYKFDTTAWGALVTLGLVFVVPDGELSTATINGFGYGFQSSVLINPARKRNPFSWERRIANIYGGVGFGYLKQGGILEGYSKNDTGTTREWNATTINTLWTMDLIGRAEILRGPIKLFAEASWGGSYFKPEQYIEYTERSLTTTKPDIKIEQTTGNRLWVQHYAYGGGFRTGSELFKLEFKLMYHVGQSVEYIDPTTVGYSATENSLTYTMKKSTTNMWLPQMTASYLF